MYRVSHDIDIIEIATYLQDICMQRHHFSITEPWEVNAKNDWSTPFSLDEIFAFR